MARFRKVEMTIERTHMYGHYMIRATYYGKEVKVVTTDSQAFDWLEDDSDKKKNLEAKRFCYNKIKEAAL